MRVLVLNGSPTGADSITLQTVLFIQKFYRNTEFEILHVGQKIRSFEKDFTPAREALRRADLILFCYPVYTFLVPSQLHRFLELIKEDGVCLRGKYATQLTTSKHFYDSTAHAFIQENCADLGLRYIRGLSADMEDLLKPEGQKDALEFFRFVRWNMKHGFGENAPHRCSIAEKPETAGEMADDAADSGRRIVIVADLSSPLEEMIRTFSQSSPIPCDIVNIREFPFRGGCLGCFNCAADGTCVYTDGFDTYLREHIQTADAIVYAYTVQDHSMGSRFKMFDDRQFCNGHRTVTMGKPVAYIVDGSLQNEPNLQILMHARAQVGGNFLAGAVCSAQENCKAALGQLAQTLAFAVKTGYNPPQDFYGVGGRKIFRDLIYQMQGLMREDHRFYKAHGFYDFPQKRRGTIAFMYLAGAMMTNKKLKKKLGGRMTEGMLMPYKHVQKRAEKARSKKRRTDR